MTERNPVDGARSPKAWWRRWFLVVPAGVLLLLILSGALLLGRAWSPAPPALPDNGEIRAVQQVMAKTTRALIAPDGRIAELAVIELSPAEVDALMNIGWRVWQEKRRAGEPSAGGRWRDGGVNLELSQPLPAGFALNAAVRATPELAGGRLRVKIHSGRVGRLRIPAGLLQAAADRQLPKLEALPEVQAALPVFESVTALENGNLELRLHPRQVGPFLRMLMLR